MLIFLRPFNSSSILFSSPSVKSLNVIGVLEWGKVNANSFLPLIKIESSKTLLSNLDNNYINNLNNLIHYLFHNNKILYKLLYFELKKMYNKYNDIIKLKNKNIIINNILYNNYEL